MSPQNRTSFASAVRSKIIVSEVRPSAGVSQATRGARPPRAHSQPNEADSACEGATGVGRSSKPAGRASRACAGASEVAQKRQRTEHERADSAAEGG